MKLFLCFVLLFSLISCDKSSDAPDKPVQRIAKTIVANGLGQALTDILKCKNSRAVKNHVALKFGLQVKSLTGIAKVICDSTIEQYLPFIIKDNQVPTDWDCEIKTWSKGAGAFKAKVCGLGS